MWKARDLTGGDESSCYNLAHLWFTRRRVNVGWSPLDTALYGTLMHITPDAYVVTFSAEFHDRTFMLNAWPMEIHGYVGHNCATNPLANLDYSAVPAGADLAGFLASRGLTLLYVDEHAWAKLRPCELQGWRPLIYQSTEAGQWGLFRADAPSPGDTAPPRPVFCR